LVAKTKSLDEKIILTKVPLSEGRQMATYCALILLGKNAKTQEVLTCREAVETANIFHLLVEEAKAFYNETGLAAVSPQGLEFRYLIGQAINGYEVALLIKHRDGHQAAYLFNNPISAAEFGSKFRDCLSQQVMPVDLVQKIETIPAFLQPQSSELPPFKSPAGWCPQCGDHLLTPDAFGLYPSTCQVCQRLVEYKA
jgi:hypothetical protein